MVRAGAKMLLAVAAVCWSFPAAADPPAWGLETVEGGVADTVVAGSELSVVVALRNTGSEVWGAGDGWSVAAHWWRADGTLVAWEGPRTPIPGTVAPGHTLRLVATVVTPREPGRYLVGWDVVHEGVLWVSRAAVTDPGRSPVEVVATHAVTLHADVPRMVVADARRTARIELVNDGTMTWSEGGGVAVAAHWLDRAGRPVVWEGPRTPMPRDVEPGQSVVVDAVVDVPSAPGVYRLQWDLVDEGVCWFSDRDPSMPVPSVVVVLPRVPVTLGWLLAVAAVSWWTVRRAPEGGPLGSAADVWWWLGAVAVKEWSVLSETGPPPDAAAVCIAVGGAAVLVLPALLFTVRVRPWVVWTLGALASAILWADALHLRFFHDLVSVSAVRSVGQVDEVMESVVSLARWRDVLLFADLVVVLPVMRRVARVRDSRRWVVLPVALAVVVAAVPLGRLLTGERAALQQVFRQTILAREIGILDTHVVDVVRSAGRGARARRVDPEAASTVEDYLKDTTGNRAATGSTAGVAAGANLVMIQVESLQHFVIGLEVEGREVTPFLNRWSDTGLLFTEITDQTAQGRSSDAELATQASVLPPLTGAAAFRYVGNRFVGLADVLSDRGYHTVSAVAYEGGFWNRRTLHPAFGYARSLFVDDFEPGPVVGWGLNDRDFLHQMRTRLVSLPRPFAVWMITLSLHHPFDGFPARFAELDVGRWAGTPLGNYLQTMRFLDRSLERFVTGLDQDGVGRETVVVLWGDHDAGFEWTARFADLLGLPHDAAGWYRSQRVPLLIRVPGDEGPSGLVIQPGGHVDVAPTVLALLGVDAAPLPWLGRNLLGTPGDEPVIGEYGCWSTRRLLYLVGGPELEDGRCLERTTLRPLPVAECAAGWQQARVRAQASHTLLEGDLQARVAEMPSGR